jgi:hypothetical protein
VGADDPVIKGLLRLMVIDDATECEPHGRYAAIGATPQVHPNQGLRLETPCSFFAGLANDCSDQGLASFDVTGRLIEHQALIDAFFD